MAKIKKSTEKIITKDAVSVKESILTLTIPKEETTTTSLGAEIEIIKSEEEKIVEQPIINTPKQIFSNEKSEIEFLEMIYKIQNDGGFGVHLNKHLEERINKLKG